MSNPAQVIDAIHRDAAFLDELSKALYEWTNLYDKAADAWEAHLDTITADLEEEFAAAGRKSVPEHTALSAARRANRELWTNFKTSKRTLERLEKQLQAKRAALSGRQSELGALRDEVRAGEYGTPRATQTFGRAA